nr:hypothetical protein [Tanacetum cinerariifolium]
MLIGKDLVSGLLVYDSPLSSKMDNPNITIKEYIRHEEEKAHRRGKVYNWEAATYGKLVSKDGYDVLATRRHIKYTQPTLNVQPTLESIIQPTDVNAEEINTDQAENAAFKAYEFINPFAPPRIEAAESSPCNIDTSNMHTFTKDTIPTIIGLKIIL